MRHVAGFWNRNDLAVPNGPGQGNGGGRTSMCCADTRERRITQQRAARSPEWGVGHYWYCVLRTPWQQVMFDGAVIETVVTGFLIVPVAVGQTCTPANDSITSSERRRCR